VKKMKFIPLTLPSPSRGEGEHIEIKKIFPPPRGGRMKVGVIQKIISHLRGGKGGGDAFEYFLQRLGYSSENLP